MKRKYVYVGFAYPHHLNSHAGYHQVRNYIDYDYVVDCQRYFNLCRKSKTIVGRGVFYLARAILLSCYRIRLIVLGLKYDNLVFHYIYGENILFNIKLLIRKGNKVVCTIHQPFETIINNKILSSRLKGVDAIILVGKTEIEMFESKFHKRVVFIPHGICTDFYTPINCINKGKMILTVGNWLRDYKFADSVYQDILRIDSSVKICIVSLDKNRASITPNDRVSFLSGISDEELKVLYCKSSILFLPLTRYTANNSLLEAAATGCNIIIASDHSDNSYIPDNLVTLLPINKEKVVETLINGFVNKYNMELVNFVRPNYSWEQIAKRICALYEDI